jgi:hypothetical protein
VHDIIRIIHSDQDGIMDQNGHRWLSHWLVADSSKPIYQKKISSSGQFKHRKAAQ